MKIEIKTLEEFQNRIGNNFEALSYIDRLSYAKIKCKNCKNIFFRTPKEMYRNCTCPNCIKNSKLNRERLEHYNSFVEAAKLKNFEVLDNASLYKNNQSFLKVRCLKCLKEFKTTANSLPEKECICKKLERIFNNFKNKIDEMYGKNEYEFLSEYKSLNYPIKIKHKCGYEYKTIPKNLLDGKRCFNCYGSKKKTTEEVKALLKEKTNDEYELLSEYTGNKCKLKIKHKICGKIFYPNYCNFFNSGTRCPNCIEIKSKSNEELEIFEFIKSKYSNAKSIYRTVDNETYELDIFIPELKLGFEFNGLYWHSTKIHPDPNYHKQKSLFFKRNFGINVIHIFEDEWEFNKDAVKKRITDAFKGKFYGNTAYNNPLLLNEELIPEIYYIRNRKRYNKRKSDNDLVIYGCGKSK